MTQGRPATTTQIVVVNMAYLLVTGMLNPYNQRISSAENQKFPAGVDSTGRVYHINSLFQKFVIKEIKNPVKLSDFTGFLSKWGDSNSRHLAPQKQTASQIACRLFSVIPNRRVTV